jgi:hypothetical protein
MMARLNAARRGGEVMDRVARGAALSLILAMLSGGLPGAAAAEPSAGVPVVVELFTSQGCSSCPPADALLATLATREDVIALALHVDYWDYIGWEDEFAESAFTERQKMYARAAGARTIYTPQMIVGGMEHLVGVRPEELSALIGQHLATPLPVAVRLSRSDGSLLIDASAERPLERPAVVQLVRYLPSETVEITRGENAGQRVTYANIVQDWTDIGVWDGAAPLSLRETISGSSPAVVIVQEVGAGRILGAARLW